MLRVNVETENEIGPELIKHIINSRLRIKKNTFIALVGGNGEAKSYDAIRIAELIDPNFDPLKQMIIRPEQFIDVIKNAKKEGYKVIVLDEAQTTIDSRMFHSLINKAITYVTSTFRQVNALCVIIVCPNLNWIEKKVRELVNYYGVCYRKEYTGGMSVAHMKLFEIYINYYDLQNQDPRLRKIKFLAKVGDQKTRRLTLGTFDVGLASERLTEVYEKVAVEYKTNLIETQLEDVIKHLAKDKDAYNLDKIVSMVLDDKNLYKAVVKERNGEIKIRSTTLKNLFKLNPIQVVEIESKIHERLENNANEQSVF